MHATAVAKLSPAGECGEAKKANKIQIFLHTF